MSGQPAIGSASSIPRTFLDGLADGERGGDAEPTRPIRDPELWAAFTAAYRAWRSRDEQLCLFDEVAA